MPQLEKTVPFFEAIGFKKIGGVESYPSVFLTDGSIMLTVWKTKVDSPVPFNRHENVGLHHLAVSSPSMEALNKAFEIVSAIDGVVIEFPPQQIPGMPMTHFMCYEPCGVRVEFAYRNA